jgi:hypothetical protein
LRASESAGMVCHVCYSFRGQLLVLYCGDGTRDEEERAVAPFGSGGNVSYYDGAGSLRRLKSFGGVFWECVY